MAKFSSDTNVLQEEYSWISHDMTNYNSSIIILVGYLLMMFIPMMQVVESFLMEDKEMFILHSPQHGNW